MKTNWVSDNIKAILSLVVIAFGFAYFFYCGITSVKPDPSITIADVGFISSVLGYWFGSSSGSAKKDEVIGNAMAAGVPSDVPIVK